MSDDIQSDVLLVDDQEKFLQVFSERLSSRGLKVDTCISGEDAVQCIQSKKYDAVILDLFMPKGIDERFFLLF